MKRKHALAASAAVVAMTLGTPLAFADNVTVGGQLNRGGTLVQYSAYRTHTFAGAITLNLTDNTANYTRLGLRDTGGYQFTATREWRATGSQPFALWNGSTHINSGKQFAFNGRMGSCSWWCDNYWGGSLNY